jgi:hypothetical protein
LKPVRRVLLLALFASGCAEIPPPAEAPGGLVGPTGQLVRFQGGKDGRPFLSLMADGGIYEFEPAR